MSLNKSELVSAIASKADLSKADAEKALNAFQEVLIESLGKGEAVKVTGLLSVARVARAARPVGRPRPGDGGAAGGTAPPPERARAHHEPQDQPCDQYSSGRAVLPRPGRLERRGLLGEEDRAHPLGLSRIDF